MILLLDLDQAITIARATESAEQEVELMADKGTKEDPFVLNHLGTTTSGRFEGKKKSACYRCGNEDIEQKVVGCVRKTAESGGKLVI